MLINSTFEFIYHDWATLLLLAKVVFTIVLFKYNRCMVKDIHEHDEILEAFTFFI